jgi:hypothetical protein
MPSLVIFNVFSTSVNSLETVVTSEYFGLKNSILVFLKALTSISSRMLRRRFMLDCESLIIRRLFLGFGIMLPNWERRGIRTVVISLTGT